MAVRASKGGPVEGPQARLLETDDPTGFLDSFTGPIADRLTPGGGQVCCAVTVLHPTRSTTVADPSAHSAAVGEIRHGYGDGPCLRVAREHRTAHVIDFRTDPWWADYGSP